jgi:hypothetical protein
MSNAVTSGLGWLTKLMLWMLVGLLAVMYLNALPRRQGPQTVATPVPASAPAPTQAPVAASSSAPVQQAESAAFADSLMAPKAVPVPAAEPAAVAPAPKPAPVAAPVAQQPVAAAPAPVSEPVPAQVAPAPSRAPAAAAAPPASKDSIEARRAQVMSEFQQMRRAALEEMRAARQEARKQWERRGAPGPMGAPYGYPGYGPGYAPVPYMPAPGYPQAPAAPR